MATTSLKIKPPKRRKGSVKVFRIRTATSRAASKGYPTLSASNPLAPEHLLPEHPSIQLPAKPAVHFFGEHRPPMPPLRLKGQRKQKPESLV